jgi:phage-related protein
VYWANLGILTVIQEAKQFHFRETLITFETAVSSISEQKKYRTIVFYKHYFEDFFKRKTKKVKAKIVWTFELIEELPKVPENYLKHIENTDGLYEIRVQLGSDIFRIFCFFDEGKLVVLANGFQKKTQKTPKQEIALASKIKMAYDNDK